MQNTDEQKNINSEKADEKAENTENQNLKVNKKGFIEAEGEIEELLPGLKFKVILENGHEIMATIAGRMRMYRITLVMGDKVRVEMSPYDLTKGRITFRL